MSGSQQAIPPAATAAQQELEAHVLLALRDIRQLRNHDLPFYPFRYVTPKSHSLELSLLPHHLGSFAFGMAPRSHDNEIAGVPGLRVTSSRRGITLRLLSRDGHPTDANVLLKDVTPTQWSKAMSWTNDEYVGTTQDFFVHEPALTATESQYLRQYERLRAHPMLASLVLRRLHLLSAAGWIDVWTADSAIKIEWFEGPQLREVARRLIDPDVGLVAEGVSLRRYHHELINSDLEPYSLDFRGPAPQTGGTVSGRGYPEGALIMRRTD
ncbi:hypothetical protein [Kutzneria sp. CA-103260]|uniref:hypothetical protein n=1 Tax=Kutzneria sp. CA-103260 TaxID=2802641 RepID=UPI001BAC2E0C|nr:hypothetical protein [Kutzneria sp. CA-103260]